MCRESMSERNKNPKYYETIQCENCGSTEGLTLHAYANDILCIGCVNDKLAEAAREDEEVTGRYYDEDKADEDRLEYLIQEREA